MTEQEKKIESQAQAAQPLTAPTQEQLDKAERMRKVSREGHSKTKVLENRIADQEKRIQELTEHLKSHGTTAQAPETATPTPKEHREPKLGDKVPTHYVKNWMANCPECGDANPNFKDETACKACGQHLGSVETAKKLDNCPYCGKNEGVRKV